MKLMFIVAWIFAIIAEKFYSPMTVSPKVYAKRFMRSVTVVEKNIEIVSVAYSFNR